MSQRIHLMKMKKPHIKVQVKVCGKCHKKNFYSQVSLLSRFLFRLIFIFIFIIIPELFQYGQAKIINANCLKDAAEHMKILELVRKEFRYLRLLWTNLSDSLYAHDEIVMAKSRLRLGNNLNDDTGPPKKKFKKIIENDVVFEEYVSYS